MGVAHRIIGEVGVLRYYNTASPWGIVRYGGTTKPQTNDDS